MIVLDSCGAGKLPDAADFGDFDCNTIKRISTSDRFDCTNTREMGLGNVEGLGFLGAVPSPTAAYGKMAERSRGKDTTIGHWEIAGIISDTPLPTYPNGFPKEILDEFSRRTGRGVLCNAPYSGTDVIRDFGRQHAETGDLIVYTSADSVFQIAANEAIVPPEQLYEYCRIAREILCGEHSVGRVIARPFEGEYPNFKRTANRRDFSLEPYGKTMLDAISESGKTVYAVGKISDIFAGRGVTKKTHTHSNKEGMQVALEALGEDFEGLCFVNLVDFDMVYGHRQDVDGYANAFAEFDRWLPSFTSEMKDGDILIITADHGCDPGDSHTDHTREYVPVLIYGKSVAPKPLGVRSTFSDVAATVTRYLDVEFDCQGKSML